MAERDAKGRFVKGVSGNPGGRKASELSVWQLIDEAVTREDWLEIINRLLIRARRGDLKAIDMLLDRRFGKPVQTNLLGGEGGGPIQVEQYQRALDMIYGQGRDE